MVSRGSTNSLVDVPGFRVGHHTRRGAGWLTGTTVVLPPPGTVGGVDVRGGGPGTRETDLLDPRAHVSEVHAVVLTGGSAYGLAAADGVMQRLGEAGIGYPVPVLAPGQVVPIVPAAVVFDLARGGDFHHRPDAAFGVAAYDAAAGPEGSSEVELGVVGAGTGAVVGGLKGGVGSASALLPDGATVGALAVVNAVGSAVDPLTGELYGARFALDDELGSLCRPAADEVAAAREAAQAQAPGSTLATTLVVLATDLTLTKAQCAKVAGLGHDGLARAVRPVHTMLDGDTVFTLASGARPAPDLLGFHQLLDVAADCVTRAVVRGVLTAASVETPAGRWRGYRGAFPSAVGGDDGARDREVASGDESGVS